MRQRKLLLKDGWYALDEHRRKFPAFVWEPEAMHYFNVYVESGYPIGATSSASLEVVEARLRIWRDLINETFKNDLAIIEKSWGRTFYDIMVEYIDIDQLKINLVSSDSIYELDLD